MYTIMKKTTPDENTSNWIYIAIWIHSTLDISRQRQYNTLDVGHHSVYIILKEPFKTPVIIALWRKMVFSKDKGRQSVKMDILWRTVSVFCSRNTLEQEVGTLVHDILEDGDWGESHLRGKQLTLFWPVCRRPGYTVIGKRTRPYMKSLSFTPRGLLNVRRWTEEWSKEACCQRSTVPGEDTQWCAEPKLLATIGLADHFQSFSFHKWIVKTHLLDI